MQPGVEGRWFWMGFTVVPSVSSVVLQDCQQQTPPPNDKTQGPFSPPPTQPKGSGLRSVDVQDLLLCSQTQPKNQVIFCLGSGSWGQQPAGV